MASPVLLPHLRERAGGAGAGARDIATVLQASGCNVVTGTNVGASSHLGTYLITALINAFLACNGSKLTYQ